jgi:hypothetical protein
MLRHTLDDTETPCIDVLTTTVRHCLNYSYWHRRQMELGHAVAGPWANPPTQMEVSLYDVNHKPGVVTHTRNTITVIKCIHYMTGQHTFKTLLYGPIDATDEVLIQAALRTRSYCVERETRIKDSLSCPLIQDLIDIILTYTMSCLTVKSRKRKREDDVTQ